MLDYQSTPKRFAVDLVLMHEGGLAETEGDPGGITNWGISLKAYPALGREGIRRLTRDDAVSIYERDYWAPIRGDDLPSVPAIVMMDAGVNCGPGRAIQWLRQAVGFEPNGDLEIGEQVLRATQAAALDVAQRVTVSRLWRYDTLIQQHPPLIKFLRGWRRRVIETLAQAVIYGERNR